MCSSDLDFFVEFLLIEQLEKFENRFVVLLEGELAETEPIPGHLGFWMGTITGQETLEVSGCDRIELSVVRRVSREVELQRRIQHWIGALLGGERGGQHGKTQNYKKSMLFDHRF